MKGSEAIAKILKLERVPFVTAYPGGGPSSPVSSIINESAAVGLRTQQIPRVTGSIQEIMQKSRRE